MTTQPPSKKPSDSAESGAAGDAWRPSRVRLVVALLLVVGSIAALWLLLMPSISEPPVASTVATPAAVPPVAPGLAVSAPTPRQAAPLPRLPEGDADPTPDLKSYVARGENPSMAEVIERLHQKGIYTGLGAFSPPGTSPPLVGLAVPEDFVLPKGYVRHHQATDDGQRIEAILMFAPDYQMLDANGQPIPMPANRVVPPELAPQGLPIRRIVIPVPNDPAAAGRRSP